MARKHCAHVALIKHFKLVLKLEIKNTFLSFSETKSLLLKHYPDVFKDLGIPVDKRLSLKVIERITDHLKITVNPPRPKIPKGEGTKKKKIAKLKVTANLEFYKTDDFLKSRDWSILRYQALVKHGAKCQCCGATAKDGVVINVDHIKPRKTHPELALNISNLQILCNVCNRGKENWDDTDWR